MIYQLFLMIMNCLTYHFGYLHALIIKDTSDGVGGIVLGVLIIVLIFSDFIIHLRHTPNLDPEIAITKFRSPEGKAYYMINPKTKGQAIGTFVGYLFLIFAKDGSLKIRTVKYWTAILGILMLVVFLLGVLLSLWHYLPDGGSPYGYGEPSSIMKLFGPY